LQNEYARSELGIEPFLNKKTIYGIALDAPAATSLMVHALPCAFIEQLVGASFAFAFVFAFAIQIWDKLLIGRASVFGLATTAQCGHGARE
jgi:uncharacterized membrane protein YagU involved in acid resistance